jgi:hypothetical protein
MIRRFLSGLLLATLAVALVPGIAMANVTGDCDGSATIKGETYTPANDTPKNAIPIPNEAGVVVKYSGSVGFANTNHSGSAKVVVGPFNITLGNPWGGSNPQDDRSVTDQSYQLDDFRDKLPIWIPGVWKVTATHHADGGDCTGFAMIKLEGNPLGNVVGWVALLGTIGLLYGLIEAIRKHRMTGAIFAGLFLGLFLALDLMMWAIKPLDNLTVVVIPVLLAIIGLIAALLLRRGRPSF